MDIFDSSSRFPARRNDVSRFGVKDFSHTATSGRSHTIFNGPNIFLSLYALVCAFVLTLFVGCGFQIEESPLSLPVTIAWEADAKISHVTVRKFSTRSKASAFFHSGSSEKNFGWPSAKPIGNGDKIVVTAMQSGFRSERLAHNYLIFEYRDLENQTSVRETVPLLLEDVRANSASITIAELSGTDEESKWVRKSNGSGFFDDQGERRGHPIFRADGDDR